MDTYDEYLVDHPDDAPISLKGAAKGGWMYQHLYFQRPFYMQDGIPRYIRDEVLRKFCTSPYNQVAMREDIEDQLHDEFEEHVLAPPPETMRKAHIDFDKLDVLGAAAVGRRVALAPEALQYLAPEAELSVALTDQYSPVERAEMFNGTIDRTLEELIYPMVISHRIINGAISRIGRLINDNRLLEEAQNRLSEDEVYYPVRLRTPKFYYSLSHIVLQQEASNPVLTAETAEPQVDNLRLVA